MTLLVELAVARSGDKGDIVNIAVIAHDDAAYQRVVAAVTAARVKTYFRDWVRGPVERYELPNLGAVNFVLHGALGGGVARTLRIDSLGKAMGLAVLRMEVPQE
ncbi:MAG: hypothetical protein GEU94_01380 [Micromonosporaceae bacterium]|nr:hypothetical protein [Micromonosporaceae bacterium]